MSNCLLYNVLYAIYKVHCTCILQTVKHLQYTLCAVQSIELYTLIPELRLKISKIKILK